MTLRKLPKIDTIKSPDGLTWDVDSDALEYWTGVTAAEADDKNTISVYDKIGGGMFSDGYTTRRLAGALREIGPEAITVKINSPGGNVFEALGMFNLLREHPAKVTVDIVGIAASAASIVVMAGDVVRMGTGTMLMIHNSRVVAQGDRALLAHVSEVLEAVDGSMREIYAVRANMTDDEISAAMDAETFFTAKEAIKNGMADETMELPKADDPKAAIPEHFENIKARRVIERALGSLNIPRANRVLVMKAAGIGPRDATDTVERDADLSDDDMAAIRSLTATLTKGLQP